LIVTDAETIDQLRAALAAKDQHLQEAQQEVAFLKGVRYTAIIRRAEQAEAQSATQEAQIAHLQDAIRSHRDARGDDRCWMDDEELYKTLPEGYTPPQRDSAVELQMCERFIRSRQHPATVYVSPQRRIEELEAELTAARQALAALRPRGVEMITIDARCHCESCVARTGDIYRMVGTCYNCGAKPILILYRAGDRTRPRDCPVCGCADTVHAQRLATPDEIPEAEFSAVLAGGCALPQPCDTEPSNN
jgi:hypothetical protein